MTRKAFLTVLCLLCLLTACGATVQANNTSSSQNLGSANIVMVTASTSTHQNASTTSQPSSQPTDTPTTQPTNPPAQPTTTPTSTPTTAITYHKCTLANKCPNPWGYKLKLEYGINWADWQNVYGVPSGFCSYFKCASDISTTNGFIIVCQDDIMTTTGSGEQCVNDGGLYSQLEEPKPVTPTPPPVATGTPTA